MRLLKLNSIIHPYTSIYWESITNEFHVFTDSGRLLRPLLVLKKRGSMNSNELIEGDYSYLSNWNKCIRGDYMYNENKDLSIYDESSAVVLLDTRTLGKVSETLSINLTIIL